MAKTTKRIGKIGPKAKELVTLTRKLEDLTGDLVSIALDLSARARASDAAGILMTLEREDSDA
ncbi:hypothetical protein LCGC14_1278260 [marine sediment metagenome]|uniref:Uncharacterized protein n=1 Tax=marine sediment metagenome TaxID=412755 RepID=A0A0F9KXP7_9ZZZZ